MCAAMLALAGVPAQALDPHTALAHYGYQSWQTDTGLPQNTVHAIVQGRGGFLWIATEGGLVRFDGVEFRTYTRSNTPALPSDLIDDLMEDRTGAVWISTSGGLARMQGGKVEPFGPDKGIPATQVWRTFEDKNGRVWALTASGLFRIEGDRAEGVALDAALTENSRMVEGRDGSLWLATADGLMRWNGKDEFQRLGDAGEVVALATDGTGRGWAGTRSALEMCAEGGDCQHLAIPPSAGAVHAIVRDGQGRMWLGTDGGLYAITNRIVTRCLGRARGLSPHRSAGHALGGNRERSDARRSRSPGLGRVVARGRCFSDRGGGSGRRPVAGHRVGWPGGAAGPQVFDADGGGWADG